MNFHPLRLFGRLHRAGRLWPFLVLFAVFPNSGMAEPLTGPSPWSHGGFNRRVSIVKQHLDDLKKNLEALNIKGDEQQFIRRALDLYWPTPEPFQRTTIFDGTDPENPVNADINPEKALEDLVNAGFLPTKGSPSFGKEAISKIINDAATTEYRRDDPIKEAIRIQCLLLWYQNYPNITKRQKRVTRLTREEVVENILGKFAGVDWSKAPGNDDAWIAYCRTCLWIGIEAYATPQSTAAPRTSQVTKFRIMLSSATPRINRQTRPGSGLFNSTPRPTPTPKPIPKPKPPSKPKPTPRPTSIPRTTRKHGADQGTEADQRIEPPDFAMVFKSVTTPLQHLSTYNDGFLNRVTPLYLSQASFEQLNFVTKNGGDIPLDYASLTSDKKVSTGSQPDMTNNGTTSDQASVPAAPLNKTQDDLDRSREVENLKGQLVISQKSNNDLLSQREDLKKTSSGLGQQLAEAQKRLDNQLKDSDNWRWLKIAFRKSPVQLVLVLLGAFVGGITTVSGIRWLGVFITRKKNRTQKQSAAKPMAADLPQGAVASSDAPPQDRPAEDLSNEWSKLKREREKLRDDQEKLEKDKENSAEKFKEQEDDWEKLRLREGVYAKRLVDVEKREREFDDRQSEQKRNELALQSEQQSPWSDEMRLLEWHVNTLAESFNDTSLVSLPKTGGDDLPTRITLLVQKVHQTLNALKDEREKRGKWRAEVDESVKLQRDLDRLKDESSAARASQATQLKGLQRELEEEKELRRKASEQLTQAKDAAESEKQRLTAGHLQALLDKDAEATRLTEAHQLALTAKTDEAKRVEEAHQLALTARADEAKILQSEHETSLAVLRRESQENLEAKNRLGDELRIETERRAILEFARQLSAYELPIVELAGRPWAENVDEIRKRADADSGYASSLFGWLSLLTGLVRQADAGGPANRASFHRLDVMVPCLTAISRSVIGYAEDLFREDATAKDTWGADPEEYQSQWLTALNALLRERLGLYMVAPHVGHTYDEEYMEAPKVRGRNKVIAVQSWAVLKNDNRMTLKPAEVEYR